MTLHLKQFTTPELLTALAAFLQTLESDTPNDEETRAIWAILEEIESRRSQQSAAGKRGWVDRRKGQRRRCVSQVLITDERRSGVERRKIARRLTD